jgi:hypothetical protein
MGSFFTRMAFNRKFLQMEGETDGSLGLRTSTFNGNTTIRFNSTDDLELTATGNLNATVIGSTHNDTFNFLNTTGNYNIQTRDGNDDITDGTGDSTYDGGVGADTFRFRAEGGRVEDDTINNYLVAQDDIEITGGVKGVTGTTGEVIITLADDDTITVRGGTDVTIAAIQAEIVPVI